MVVHWPLARCHGHEISTEHQAPVALCCHGIERAISAADDKGVQVHAAVAIQTHGIDNIRPGQREAADAHDAAVVLQGQCAKSQRWG